MYRRSITAEVFFLGNLLLVEKYCCPDIMRRCVQMIFGRGVLDYNSEGLVRTGFRSVNLPSWYEKFSDQFSGSDWLQLTSIFGIFSTGNMELACPNCHVAKKAMRLYDV